MTAFTLFYFLPFETAKIVTFCVTIPLVLFDIARLYIPALNDTFLKLCRPILRDTEKNGLAGSTAMLIGVSAIIFIFPRDVVLATMLFQAVADPLASFIGIRYGKDKLIGNKSFQGSLAAFAACFVLAVIFYYARGLMLERLFIVCLLSGIIGAASELMPVGKLDDNLIFPVVNATLLTGLFHVFGGL
jgi:diacylglycerol kinase (CTP)